jgi:hypothetical protein
MQKLTRHDLLPLERYAEERAAFRTRAIAHKRTRSVALGPHMTLLFEDRVTVQYQVQEMLRIERIFEAAAIEEELATYNPLIPDGCNLKATCLIEYSDVAERQRELQRLAGIEHAIQAEVAGHGRAETHADEDLERSTADKTSAVHFLRFEFSPAQRRGLAQGAALHFLTDDPRYPHRVEVMPPQRQVLLADLDG